MSMQRPFFWLATVLALVTLGQVAQAQRYQPFIEPDTFNPDLQFFAPAEVSDFGGGDGPNVGFFANYDRVYLNWSRPDGEASFESPFEGDFGWGNRWDLGYMTEDKTGWAITGWHLSGPNEGIHVLQERLDRFNDDDDPDADEGRDPILSDRNPRQYDLTQSINRADLSSVEINKIWRRKEFHNGGVFEPMVGVRYVNMKDYYRRDQYDRFAEDILGGITAVPSISGPYEVLTTDKAIYDNVMLGGQLGFRYSHVLGHWNLSTEFRAFGLQNFQHLMNKELTTTTRYSALGGDVELENKTQVRSHESNDEFVWGGEVRGEAAYEVTRDISLRFGFVIMDFAQGIGRGPTTRTSDQDLFIGGVTFGLTVNR